MVSQNISSQFTFDSASRGMDTSFATPSQIENYMPTVDVQNYKVIFGTTIDIQETGDKFKEFILRKCPHILSNYNIQTSLYFNASLLPPKTHESLLNYPLDVIPIFEQCLMDLLIEKNPSFMKYMTLRPFKIGYNVLLRFLTPSYVEKIISIKGIITRVSALMPFLQKAAYHCNNCNEYTYIEGQFNNPIGKIPPECEHCKGIFTLELDKPKSIYIDLQHAKIQETPDLCPPGQTPITLELSLYSDIVDTIKSGEKVKVNGIMRVKENKTLKGLSTSFKTYIDVLSFEKDDSKEISKQIPVEIEAFQNKEDNKENNLQTDPKASNPFNQETEADASDSFYMKNNQLNTFDNDNVNEDSNNNFLTNTIQQSINYIFIKKMAELPYETLFQILLNSIAPNVYGHETIKKAILLQLFSGIRKTHTNTRGNIHILLVGDPGIAKSQLLSFVHRIEGMYTSGKGSSAVGLTASIVKEDNNFILEPGALVLSNNSVCCIDEFDKMSDNAKATLHEVMEQQTISISKAGIVTSLNARCSILASCNPVKSRYDTKKSIIENINLVSSLLSRFDVVGLMIDKCDETNDRKIGNHIVDFYDNESKESNEEHGKKELTETELEDLFLKNIKLQKNCQYYIPVEILKQYIKYCKGLRPMLVEEAKSNLIETYLNLRQLDRGKSITATTRQLESLIRLSEAHAKMRQNSKVETVDVQEATTILKDSMCMYAIDPKTGKIDMEMINTGKSKWMKETIKDAINIILKYKKKKRISLDEIKTAFPIIQDMVWKGAIESSINEGSIIFENGLIEFIELDN